MQRGKKTLKVNHQEKPPIKSIRVFFILFIYHRILPYVEHNLTALFKIFIYACCIFGFYRQILGTLLIALILTRNPHLTILY